MDNGKKREIIILLFCVLIGFALRFYTFDQKSLWMDEIYTFNDSRYGVKEQLAFYKENPTFLHPPLFFILTHLFYPFEKPERDLRIIPLIFGILSVPMIYLLARQFTPTIAIPCTIALTFMAYHISLSQDGRSYSVLMFLGMMALYFFMKYLSSTKKRYLLGSALFSAISIHTSYSAIPFIIFSQFLWFYQPTEEVKRPPLPSVFILNGLILLFCLPWTIFLLLNYKGQVVMDPFHTEGTGSFVNILYCVLHDWVPHIPLMIASITLFTLFPFFARNKRNVIILLGVLILPILGLYLYCKLFTVTHFITSRYFINFLPLFLIALFCSLSEIERKFENLRKYLRLKVLFVILFISSSLIILPFYYKSEKQDFRGLATYLKNHLRPGDNIFDGHGVYIPGILHYFGAYPTTRHYVVNFSKTNGSQIRYSISFYRGGNRYTIYYSKSCCLEYVQPGGRLWIVLPKNAAKEVEKENPFVLKGFFDGSYLNFTRFPFDASMYLFLWDPSSPGEKGIDLRIE